MGGAAGGCDERGKNTEQPGVYLMRWTQKVGSRSRSVIKQYQHFQK